MNEVSCRLFTALGDIEKKYEIPVEEGLAGIEISREFLDNPRNRVSWDVFTQVMRNYHRLAGSAREFATMNRVIPFTAGTRSYRRLCQIAVSPATVYRLVTTFIPRLYTPVESKFIQNRNGSYTMTVTIDSAYQDCPEFFDGAVGALESYPLLIGLPLARVEGKISPHHAEYTVFPPRSGTLLARTKRWFARFWGFSSMVTTLQNQNDDLLASFEAIEQQSSDFQVVLDTLTDGVAVIRKDRVIYANAALETILGRAELSSLEGATFNQWIEASDISRLKQWVDEDQSANERREIRVLGPRKTTTIVEISPPRACSWQGLRSKLIILRDVTEQRKMTDMLAEGSHREQQRIARDLHDGLGQQIAGLALKAKILENELAKLENPDLQSFSAELVANAKVASGQARDIAYNLAPVDIDPEGLRAILRKLLESSARMFGFETSLTTDDRTTSIASESAMQVYRSVQEALTNAHRHGGATHVSLDLKNVEDALMLTIEDNGCGLPDGFSPRARAGIGLKIMRHRMSSIGGDCSVGSRTDGWTGTRVVFEVPLAPQAGKATAALDPPGPGDDQPEPAKSRTGG